MDYNTEYQEAKAAFEAQLADNAESAGWEIEALLFLPAITAWVYAITGILSL